MDQPVTLNVDLTGRIGAAGSHYEEIDELRETHPAFWNEHGPGYWVLTRFDDVRDAFQSPELLSNHSIVVTEPEPQFRMIPSNADPPEHMAYRHTMNAWFSPVAMARHEPALRGVANELIDGFIDDGGCDFVSTYGTLFPAHALVLVLGLPFSEVPVLVDMLVNLRGSVAAVGDDHKAAVLGALDEIRNYFAVLLAERRVRPADPDHDFVTHLTRADMAGRPLHDDEILDMCMTLGLGGVRTTRSQMGWCLYHLATHPDDRARIVADPAVISTALEEFLRAYPIVNMARKVTRDIEFHGCPMKKDDMVLMFIQSANRDPRVFAHADRFVIDRRPNRHITFGASAHRCIGSHLARLELQVTLEEWHRRIPDYAIDADGPLQAQGGHIALHELPLRWGHDG